MCKIEKIIGCKIPIDLKLNINSKKRNIDYG